MTVWRLTPVDLLDPSWNASSHRAAVVVRARNEAAARALAAKTFSVTTRFPPGRGIHAPPWTRTSLVRAEPIKEDRYPAKGPAEVLDPIV